MKCQSCKKKCGICTFKCKYCDNNFCTSCRMPEIHKCENMESCKQEQTDRLKFRLMKDKTTADKLVRLD